jgi:hypothetical protein
VNREKGGYGPHGTSLWSSRSWITCTKRTHKPKNTTAHKVKPEALSQLDVEACVSERTYYRTVHSTVWGWIYYRTIQSSRLEDKTHQRGGRVLLACLVVNYLFTTHGHHDIISSDTTMLSLLCCCHSLSHFLTYVEMFLSQLTILDVALLVHESLYYSSSSYVSMFEHLQIMGFEYSTDSQIQSYLVYKIRLEPHGWSNVETSLPKWANHKTNHFKICHIVVTY